MENLTYDQHPPDRELGPTVLIVDDEVEARDRLKLAISQIDGSDRIHILHATDIEGAVRILTGTLVQVVLLDKNLDSSSESAKTNGIDAIPEFLRLQPHLQILMVTGSRDIADVVRAMTMGAFGYITKEMPDNLLISHIERAIEVSTLKLNRTRRDRCEGDASNELGGHSKVFREVLRRAEILAESNRPVLLLGETGTGKSELARWIHQKRGRYLKQSNRPFFGVNVTTISKNLIESELFGHEKGAFTDARAMKQGIFELANNGTLFLDEIGELPLEFQAKLLTIIEEGRFMRVGGTHELRAAPKLIFATNRDLEAMVESGTFRKDLYMRISMFPIRMPSLAERREDIPDLVRALMPRACKAAGVQVRFEDLPGDFIEHLSHAPIEGNIRGLQHQVEHLIVLSPRDKMGNPVFTHWRSIPGLYSRGKRETVSGTLSTNAPLSYSELMRRPWNLIGPGFPGMSEFLDEVRLGLVREAQSKFKTNRMIAQALHVSESTSSLLTRRPVPRDESSKGPAQSGSTPNPEEKEVMQ